MVNIKTNAKKIAFKEAICGPINKSGIKAKLFNIVN